MLDAVIQRLASFGYIAADADSWALDFVIEKVENHIKNSCNIHKIPEGLYHIAVDMAVGSFLQEKKSADAESLAGFDLEAAVKQIQEGDTNISFAVGEGSTTPEQRLDALIAYLVGCGDRDFASYRCMQW